MPRIRTIKPEFFKHFDLYELEKESGYPCRIAYVGLWCVSDREGRFKWRPQELKLDILPHDDLDFSRVLDALLSRGFIRKYEIDEKTYGWIPSFSMHQVINNRERPSSLPSPDEFLSNEKGYIYLLLAPDVRKIKVGFSKNHPQKRVSDLSTMNASKIELIAFFEGHHRDETHIHRELDEFRSHGEWFDLNDESSFKLDAWFTRGLRVSHAASGEGKGKEGKGKEWKGREPSTNYPQAEDKSVPTSPKGRSRQLSPEDQKAIAQHLLAGKEIK